VRVSYLECYSMGRLYRRIDDTDKERYLVLGSCPFPGVPRTGNWCQLIAGSGGSQGFPARALAMASSAVTPWAAAESR
jgi:hypothetical protein